MQTIYQKALKLIKNLALILSVSCLFLWSVSAQSAYQMMAPNKKLISLRLATSRADHTKGLSGIRASDFSIEEGMLFINDEMDKRQFWMPDTYFNLDIIYLDPQLKIVAIEKNAPAHPGTKEPPVIYRAKSYRAQYILETKASAPFSKDLKIGEQLKWMGSSSLSEITLKTRQQR